MHLSDPFETRKSYSSIIRFSCEKLMQTPRSASLTGRRKATPLLAVFAFRELISILEAVDGRSSFEQKRTALV